MFVFVKSRLHVLQTKLNPRKFYIDMCHISRAYNNASHFLCIRSLACVLSPQHSSAAELSVLLQIRVHVFKVHGVLFNEEFEGPMVV